MTQKKLSALFAVLVLAAATGLAWWQSSRTPILVGVDAPLYPAALFDPSEMNAADLFAEEYPQSRIGLSKLYYEYQPEQALASLRSAMRQGVRFFVTTQPSSCAVVSMHLFTDAQALIIHTGATSPMLTGKDDFVLRIIPDAVQEQRAIAAQVNELPGQRILVLQDEGNLAYTDPAFAAFSAELGVRGHWRIVHRSLLVSTFKPAEHQALMAEPFDAIYILAGSFQPSIGNIAQLFHYLHPQAHILLTPWARSQAILETAGDALDRIILPSPYPARHQAPALDGYFQRFSSRFGYQPIASNIGVRQGLELLDQAFAKGYDTPERVKEYLLSQPTHQTSLGPVSFDRNGDAIGTYYFIRNIQQELQ
jgi:branched-chain amino acid transport system substrate-binding protein